MGKKLASNSFSGILFWLKWILVAILGFVASIAFWNWLLLERMGANFKDPRITISWFAAVFGSWFVILILLMKKKEKVMGHLDDEDEATVSWWLIWIGLTIGSFFLSVWFWTPFIAEHFGSIKTSANELIWVVAVFGTWLVALTPLMIFMYHKVDQAYEKARIQREARGENPSRVDSVKIHAVLIPEAKRKISKALSERLKTLPFTIKNGHLITAILKDGRKIKHVFIAKRSEILGIYDQNELTFNASDIIDLEPADLTHPPDFTKKTWLRLDGNS